MFLVIISTPDQYEDKIYKAWEPEREIGGFSRINPEKVDLFKYPDVAKVPWAFVTLSAGDCIFLPKSKFDLPFTVVYILPNLVTLTPLFQKNRTMARL